MLCVLLGIVAAFGVLKLEYVLLHQMLTLEEYTRKKFRSGMYLEKCHIFLLTFNTEKYTGGGSDSLGRKGFTPF